MTDPIAACRAEIAELHAFFEAWFAGTLPDTEEAFARFASVMAPGFEIVSPDGILHPRDLLLQGLRAAHASRADAPLRIWTTNEQCRALSPDLFLATYEEWQEPPGGPARGRLSTVVFRSRPDTPNGVEWLHVHEVWLPGSAGDEPGGAG